MNWFFKKFLKKLKFILADCVREGNRGERADEDDGSASLDALGEMSWRCKHLLVINSGCITLICDFFINVLSALLVHQLRTDGVPLHHHHGCTAFCVFQGLSPLSRSTQLDLSPNFIQRTTLARSCRAATPCSPSSSSSSTPPPSSPSSSSYPLSSTGQQNYYPNYVGDRYEYHYCLSLRHIYLFQQAPSIIITML